MRKLDIKEWSDWWDMGRVTSFAGGFDDNYDAEFIEFWHRQLAGERQHIVDLCCGNGALTWIANEVCNKEQAHTRITGVDIADIDPFRRLKKNRLSFPLVDFIGGTPIEQLPFESHSLDMVISQYGIEYTDLEKTIPEIGRVLKPVSKMCFIIHSDQSSVLTNSRSTIEKYNYLLGEGQFHETLLALDALYNAKRSFGDVRADPEFNRLSGRMKQAVYTVKNMQHSSGLKEDVEIVNRYVDNMAGLFSSNTKFKDRKRRKYIEGGMASVVETVNRTADLTAAARSKEQYAALIELVEKQGFGVTERGEFLYADKLNYGYVLVAGRSQE